MTSWLVPLLATIALLASLCWTITRDDSSAWQNQRARLLKQLKQQDGRHLIIVNYGPTRSATDEWIYNEADIDGAKVVWARRMNEDQNCKLVEYFKDRRIWSLDLDGSPWSPTGNPVAPSSTPVGRNPEQEPRAKAGARVEGSIPKLTPYPKDLCR